MKSFGFWNRWLQGVSVVIILFGLVMALLNQTPVFAIFNDQVDPVFWNQGGMDAAAQAFQRWVYGVLGATVAGWGVILLFLASNAFAQRQQWAWNAIAAGLGVWYIVDTAISLASGVVFNAFFNTALLVFFGLPLLFTRKYFEV